MDVDSRNALGSQIILDRSGQAGMMLGIPPGGPRFPFGQEVETAAKALGTKSEPAPSTTSGAGAAMDEAPKKKRKNNRTKKGKKSGSTVGAAVEAGSGSKDRAGEGDEDGWEEFEDEGRKKKHISPE